VSTRRPNLQKPHRHRAWRRASLRSDRAKAWPRRVGSAPSPRSSLGNRADRGPSSKSSPVSLAGIGDDDLRRSCDSFIPRMSVTPATAPNSTIGSGTRCDRAVSFRTGIVEGVRRKSKACTTAGSRSNPTVPDDRQTAQPRAERTSVEAPPEQPGDDSKPSPRIGCRAQNSGHSPNGAAKGSNRYGASHTWSTIARDQQQRNLAVCRKMQSRSSQVQ
jgi:hypothetical protein